MIGRLFVAAYTQKPTKIVPLSAAAPGTIMKGRR